MIQKYNGRHVLLLQGPMGPFFRRFGRELEEQGARVSKINFNAGDALFFGGPNAYPFRGTLDEWPQFLARFIREHKVEIVFLFGDQRLYHRDVHEITTKLGVRLFVFEEGYLRPHFLTLELGGVNGRSSIPRSADAFSGMPAEPLQEPRIHMNVLARAVVYASLYHWAITLFGWRYPRYRHHRATNAIYQGYVWLRSFARKQWFALKERKVMCDLARRYAGQYFLVPLQVRDDAQITAWSDYDSIESFIEEVAQSFAAHASARDHIVFKHHPMDRAYSEYSRFMEQVRKKTGLGERLHYVHDIPMPELLHHARGTVMVNSTTGVSSLHHGVPVLTLGKAIYDIPGMTAQVPLEQFWHKPGKVDRKLYTRFRNWLLLHNQLHGSFYRRLPGIDTPTGINWNPVELPRHGHKSAVEPQVPAAEDTSAQSRTVS